MLATYPSFFAPINTTHQYLPTRPSPLSPRSANACPRPRFWARNTMTSTKSASGSENENAMPFSKRDIKTNPVMKKAKQTPDEARERRREMFMKKLENSREDKRWSGRSEQILRSDYMTQRRKWEEERNREAHFYDVEEYEPVTEPTTPRLRAQPDEVLQEQQVDEIAQMEEEELRTLLEAQYHEASIDQEQMQDIPSSPTRYGSDDEDYDDIFMQLLSSQQVQGQVQQQDTEMMDTT